MTILTVPFADYCNVTFPGPEFDEAGPRILEVVYACGATAECPGRIWLGKGVVKHGRKFGVGWVSASGAALAGLRAAGLFREYLGAIAMAPHRVTTLHATIDVAEDGARAVHRIYRRALRGVVRFTRKAVPASQVSRVSRAAHVDGRQTGTVYIGSRKRDVSGKVYDKRNQLLDVVVGEHGADASVIALNDPGPLTRYEMQFGRHVGCTLRDVEDPGPLFWHHAGGALLPRPAGVLPWVAGAEGFVMPDRLEVDHVRQLELLLENSPDIHRMVSLADIISPREGRRWLCSKLERMQLPGAALVAAHPVRP
jgi:hypothetical protein